ncbi:MAG: EAL domain-containing protein [Lachnospiraceae bacterium]|nr:EAL domain-containing protein [Lachnospiraceae bacterium]
MQRSRQEYLTKSIGCICYANNLFGYVHNHELDHVTEMAGDPEEIEILKEYLDFEQCEVLCKRIHESKLEDVEVEDTIYPWLKIVVLDVKGQNGKSSLTWCFLAVLKDQAEEDLPIPEGIKTITDTRHMECFIDSMIDASQMLIRDEVSRSTAEEEIRKSNSAKQEMEATVRRLEATTSIVQLLDRDDEIERIILDFLRIMVLHLKTGGAQVFRVQEVYDGSELLAEYKNAEARVNSVQRPLCGEHFWNQDKAVAISADTPRAPGLSGEMQECGVNAIASIPVLVNQKIAMYVCIYECTEMRNWSVDDIRYMNDAVKVLQSILARRIQKNSLASSFESLEAILDNVAGGVFVWTAESDEMLFANRYVRSVFSKELRDHSLMNVFGNRIDPEKDNGNYEVNYIERMRWFDFYYTKMIWMDGRKALLCSLYDVTDKKNYQHKIEQQASTDYLTGLYNRMCCEKDLAKMVDTAKKEHTRGALLYMDLDDFKHINDGLGHQYGDVLLTSIAHSVQKIAGIENSCYRMGGDEFVIIVPPVEYDKLNDIIEQIKAIFTKPWFLKGADYYCTMSMGIVNFPEDSDKVEELIRKADISMYEAKKGGKNRVAFYADSSDQASGKRLDMEKNMREATIHGCDEFEVYYQPIMDVSGGEGVCCGAEALVRWDSAEMGFISPADFIPLAEYLGLINPIGSYVLEQACATCKAWNDAGFPNYKVNVNLSVVQLLQPDIVTIIERAIQKTGVNPHNLTLEVTENLAINDMRRMKDVLGSIKGMGARIALDDFGTGYSSLSHIREMPLDVIKVDQSFVKDLAADSYPQAFIRMVTQLAATLGMQVCVEGIETGRQYEALEGLNVRMIQGYYFDMPLTKEAFEAKYIDSAK